MLHWRQKIIYVGVAFHLCLRPTASPQMEVLVPPLGRRLSRCFRPFVCLSVTSAPALTGGQSDTTIVWIQCCVLLRTEPHKVPSTTAEARERTETHADAELKRRWTVTFADVFGINSKTLAALPAPLARWTRLVAATAVGYDTTQPIRYIRGVSMRTTTQWRHSLQRYQRASMWSIMCKVNVVPINHRAI